MNSSTQAGGMEKTLYLHANYTKCFWHRNLEVLYNHLSSLSWQFFYAISSSKSSNVIVLLLAQIMVSLMN